MGSANLILIESVASKTTHLSDAVGDLSSCGRPHEGDSYG